MNRPPGKCEERRQSRSRIRFLRGGAIREGGAYKTMMYRPLAIRTANSSGFCEIFAVGIFDGESRYATHMKLRQQNGKEGIRLSPITNIAGKSHAAVAVGGLLRRCPSQGISLGRSHASQIPDMAQRGMEVALHCAVGRARGFTGIG